MMRHIKSELHYYTGQAVFGRVTPGILVTLITVFCTTKSKVTNSESLAIELLLRLTETISLTKSYCQNTSWRQWPGHRESTILCKGRSQNQRKRLKVILRN